MMPGPLPEKKIFIEVNTMMTPGIIHSQGVRLKILSDPQLDEIIQSAYTIVESTGFRISKKRPVNCWKVPEPP